MGALYDRIPGDGILCKDVVFPDTYSEMHIYVSEHDKVICYCGRIAEEGKNRDGIGFYDYHNAPELSDDKKIRNKKFSYITLSDGQLQIAREYINNDFCLTNTKVKLINAGIRNLTACNMRFSACVPDEYGDANFVDEITRGLFGLTYNELDDFVDVFAKLFPAVGAYGYPKISVSTRQNNSCEMTGAWIPKGFPYIAFTRSDWRFGHVSLVGFYKHIQMITGNSLDSAIAKLLLEQGASKEVLERILSFDTAWYLQAAYYHAGQFFES